VFRSRETAAKLYFAGRMAVRLPLVIMYWRLYVAVFIASTHMDAAYSIVDVTTVAMILLL